MLTEIETKFESLLSFVQTLDEKWVIQIEKEQERIRRKKKVESRNQLLNKEKSSRRRRVSATTTVVRKPQGKPLMFRSMPMRRPEQRQKKDPAVQTKKGGASKNDKSADRGPSQTSSHDQVKSEVLAQAEELFA